MPSSFSLLLILLLLLNLLPQAIARDDFLNRTMCYCGTGDSLTGDPAKNVRLGTAPQKLDLPALQTFWYRFEYYNTQLNHIFVMEESCASNYTHPGNVEGSCWNYAGWTKKYCRHFPLMPDESSARHGRKRHRFCYDFRKHLVEDKYSFDGQVRRVSKYPLYLLGDEVRNVCEPICRQMFNMPMMQGHWDVRSSVSTIFEEADMCYECD